MKLTFQLIELLRLCLVSLILTPFAPTMWLTKIFVDLTTDLIKAN